MKKRFVSVFVAFLVLSFAIQPSSAIALSDSSVNEPITEILSDSLIQSEPLVPGAPELTNTPEATLPSAPFLPDHRLRSEEPNAELILDPDLPEEVRAHLQVRTAPVEKTVHNSPTPEVIALTQAQVQSFNCATVTDVPQIECEALVALYSSTNGAGWSDKTNWLLGTVVGNWWGVVVGEGRVTDLSLANNQLTGSIPSQLGNLANLQVLALYYNQLTGSIRSELGGLSNLQYLELADNQLTGSIPSQLGNLTNLQTLWLSYNQLTGSIPSQLSNLANLQHLELDSNQLAGSIPSELGNLTNLQELTLATNQLIGSIPSELGNLTNLQELTLAGNQLIGSIPSQLARLANLQEFRLGHNQLTGSIPSQLGSMANLQYLELDSNQLTGSIPSQLGSMANLQVLTLDSNQLTGSIPSQLGSLANLQVLALDSNLLTGSIPLSFANLSNLYYFSFHSTSLCEPSAPEFLAWKSGVTIWAGTGTVCDPCVGPSGLNVCNLEPGDILLSRSPTYAALFSFGGTYFTHAAMYIGDVAAQGGGQETVMPRIVEAQGPTENIDDQVWETGLFTHRFWTGLDILDFAVIRPRFPQSVKDAAIQYIREKAIASDITFNLLTPKWTTNEFYCSKLVWRSYLDVPGGGNLEVDMGFFSDKLNDFVTPDDLYYSIILGSKLVQSKHWLPWEQIVLALYSPAHIMLVDPEGRRTGFDPETRMILEEIPFATYTAPPAAEVETISAVGVSDNWTVVITGYGTGGYVLEQSYLDWKTKIVIQDGVTAPGKIEVYPILDPIYQIFLPLTTK